MTSVDLKDAYFQFPVHPGYRKYLRIIWQDRIYQFKAQVFTRVFGIVAAFLHAQGIRLLRYLDDWLFLEDSPEAVARSLDLVISTCLALIIRVNVEKSELRPTQRMTYLGMVIDSVTFRAFPSEERTERFSELAEKFMTSLYLPAYRWESLLGMMSSLLQLDPGSSIRCGLPQCGDRRTIEEVHGGAVGVGAQPMGLQTSLGSLGLTISGLVHHQSEQQGPTLFLFVAGGVSLGGGRLSSSLGWSGGIRLPSDQGTQTCHPEAERLTRVRYDPDRPLVGETAMVP